MSLKPYCTARGIYAGIAAEGVGSAMAEEGAAPERSLIRWQYSSS